MKIKMKSKILIICLIAIIAIVAVFLVLQKEDIKVHNVEEAIELLKQNYSISNNYSVINITNGWRFELLKIEGNCSLECIERHIYFDVYKNGSVIKSENSTNVTKLENENDALNYVLYRFPEFKNIGRCEFEEKLMCHEDIIVERIDKGWNITFMNESKGCNNECVIEHYYGFLVEKDGDIRKSIERERKITLKDFAVDVRTCTENLTLIGAKWWATPEQVPADEILILWYFENIGKPINIEGMPAEEHIILSGSPPKDVVVEGTYIIDGKPYLLLIDAHSNTVYRINKTINKTESIYNTILEKFSTKTINNESDVLEAFERYLKLFVGRVIIMKTDKIKQCFTRNGEVPTYRINYMKTYMEIIEYTRTGGAGFEDRLNPKIIKKGNYWLANISVVNCPSCKMRITDYKIILTNRGAVIDLNIANTTTHTFCLPPL